MTRFGHSRAMNIDIPTHASSFVYHTTIVSERIASPKDDLKSKTKQELSIKITSVCLPAGGAIHGVRHSVQNHLARKHRAQVGSVSPLYAMPRRNGKESQTPELKQAKRFHVLSVGVAGPCLDKRFSRHETSAAVITTRRSFTN